MSFEQGKPAKAADSNHDNQIKQAGKDNGFEDARHQADAAAVRLSAESNQGEAARPKDKVAVNDGVAKTTESGDGYVIKQNPSDYASYASSVKQMPETGPGSKAEIHDAFAFHAERATSAEQVAWLTSVKNTVMGTATLQA